MTDPMDALNGLQAALDARAVQLNQCELHPELKVLLDHPNGEPRFTYAYVANRTVQAIALFVLTEPQDGLHCFQVGVAVIDKMRGKGLGRQIIEQSINELKNGLRRTPMKEFYLEAIVSTGNNPSNAIARRLFSDSPTSCTDQLSKEPALQYLRKVESGA